MPEDAEPWASDVIQGEGTFTRGFDVVGVYDTFGLHERIGQVGTVVVGEPMLDAEPAMEPVDASVPASARKQLELHHDLIRERLS